MDGKGGVYFNQTAIDNNGFTGAECGREGGSIFFQTAMNNEWLRVTGCGREWVWGVILIKQTWIMTG